VFGLDIHPPGRRVAVLRLAPKAGVGWSHLNTGTAERLPGVRQVLPCPDWPTPAIAVIADTTWQALRGAAAIDVTWGGGLGGFGDDRSHRTVLEETSQSDEGLRFRNEGEAAAHWDRAEPAHRLEAVYSVPHVAHAALEPMNATALWKDGRLQLWTGTQSPILARWHAARIADIPIDAVTLEIPFLGGGFGRRLESDVVEQVTRLALQCPDTPIQLVWTREQDFQHDVYRPAAACHLRAVLTPPHRRSHQATAQDSSQAPVLEALTMAVAAPSVSDAMVRRTLPAWMTNAMPESPDKVQIEGLYDLPYAIPQIEARQILTASALPIGSWRSVGHSHNAFFLESFLDEVANQAGSDPAVLRRQLLVNAPRHQAVLDAVLALSDWNRPLPKDRARGLALHASFGAVCAHVAEVSLDSQGLPQVHRVSCAVDVGTIVHLDGVKAQMEGAIIFGISAALWGHVPFTDGVPTLSNWADAPVARMSHAPEIRIEVLPSDAPPEGAGEPGVPPVAPAIANALFQLDGQRRRRLPLISNLRA
jgi:isoquinoline 1-oxidoreductase beta subunit